MAGFKLNIFNAVLWQCVCAYRPPPKHNRELINYIFVFLAEQIAKYDWSPIVGDFIIHEKTMKKQLSS